MMTLHRQADTGRSLFLYEHRTSEGLSDRKAERKPEEGDGEREEGERECVTHKLYTEREQDYMATGN